MTSLIHEIYFAACKLQEHILSRNPEFHLVAILFCPRANHSAGCRILLLILSGLVSAEPQKLTSTSISPTFSGAFAPWQIASVHATLAGAQAIRLIIYMHAVCLHFDSMYSYS